MTPPRPALAALRHGRRCWGMFSNALAPLHRCWGISADALAPPRRGRRFTSVMRRGVGQLLALGLAGVCTMGGLAGCEVREDLTPGAVLYEIDWTKTGIRRSPEGRGWRARTDRGFEVELEAGWLVIRSIEMTACDHKMPPSTSPLVGLLDMLSPLEALAGHTGIRDPSASPVPVVADLARLSPLKIQVVDVPRRQYCRLHLLVARTGPGTVGLPRGEPMLRLSLVLHGQSRAAGDPQGRPFEVRTSLANGRLFDFERPIEHERDRQTVVRLEADPGRLFAGIDVARAAAPEIARSVLTNLFATMRLVRERP